MKKSSPKKKNDFEIRNDHVCLFIPYKDIVVEVLISEEDMWLLDHCCWSIGGHGYIQGTRKNKKIRMHTTINPSPKGFYTDHINRDIWDNRRENLRTVTPSRSQWNTNRLGVDYKPERNKWRAYMNLLGKFKFLGYFETMEEALIARQDGVRKYRGEEYVDYTSVAHQ